jgi:peroxin-5
LWDREFSSQETLLAAPPIAQAQEAPQILDAQQVAQEGDELARTAGLLLETVRDDIAQNPKFQKSEFLGLMRGLRDREVVVEGNDMVANTGQSSASGWASDFQTDLKGKGRAVDPIPLGGALDAENARKSVSFASMASVRLAEQQQQQPMQEDGMLDEDPNDAYFRQDNAEYQQYWATANAPAQASTSQLQNAEWDHLQADWDNFEATSTGIKPVDRYIFQKNNPYVSDTPSFTTRHHLAHQGRQQLLDVRLTLSYSGAAAFLK